LPSCRYHFWSLMLPNEDLQPPAGPNLSAAILLAGPGGAGKTTIGRLVARRLGVPFFDLDEQFVARYGDIRGTLGATSTPRTLTATCNYSPT
jgi:hypothetical protein